MPRPALSSMMLVIGSLSLTACRMGTHYPTLRGPGSAAFQRANAEAFDPYPLPDLGPPIDGGRPREFSTPRNEVERAQDFEIVRRARSIPVVPSAGTVFGTPVPVGSPVPMTTTAPPFVPTTPAPFVPTTPQPFVPTTPQQFVPTTPIAPSLPAQPEAPYGQPSIRY